MIRQTSITAYRDHLNNGRAQTQSARIYRIVKRRVNMTLREIQRQYERRYERIDIGTISARVCALKDHGILAEEAGPRKCSVSHVRVMPVRAAECRD